MTISERVESFLSSFWGAIGAAVAGGVTLAIRKMLTDSQRITTLETRLDLQDVHRKERDQAQLNMMGEVKDALSEVRQDIKGLYGKD